MQKKSKTMAQQVTLGGNRLGSGNKNKIALHKYERSTHNLSQTFTSSMQVGTLYPFLCIPAMRGDKFEINLNADARTIPTKGPLFGSFKMQVDLFQCDVRLYQAILHNNPLAIGMKMGQVKFPVTQITLNAQDAFGKYRKQEDFAFSNSCLNKYLGMSGIGTSQYPQSHINISRKINAIPMLAYYEIFKTYYANKQEENAYVIGTEIVTGNLTNFGNVTYYFGNTFTEAKPIKDFANRELIGIEGYPVDMEIDTNNNPQGYEKKLYLYTFDADDNLIGGSSFADLMNDNSRYNVGAQSKVMTKIGINKYRLNEEPNYLSNVPAKSIAVGYLNNNTEYTLYTNKQRGLEAFPLENIDTMRLKLLSHHALGTPFMISSEYQDDNAIWGNNSGKNQDGKPYILNCDDRNLDILNGLCVKTYQSDLFNNWVNTEWIDGENGIAAITAISASDGKVLVDSINFAEKLYNMLNRVAVSDGSYEGWQDAVYTETPKRHIESPIYLGGMSSEIVFEEIVQTAQGDEESPLGTLGGKGKLLKRKGGHVVVKTNEAAFIIGIVSLTPRINYSQGNEFYLTDLLSMDDLHKPALDGIGFQNLIGERMAWWDTKLYSGEVYGRSTIGKLPAWIEYMTAVNKTFGDFAETEGRGFMALNRHYEMSDDYKIKDATTYIDPTKYNYAFAVNDIEAQNFWVQIYSDIKARRLMSAKQIPNI